VIAIFFNLLWHHAVRSNLLDAATLESANLISKQYAVGPLAYPFASELPGSAFPLVSLAM